MSSDGLNNEESKFRKFVIGGICGCISKSIISPIDRIKVIFQTTTKSFSLANSYYLYKDIMKNDSVFSLWKGNGFQLIRVFPYSAIQLFCFDEFTLLYCKYARHKPSSFINLLIGSLSGSISVILTYPLDFLRTRKMLELGSNNHSYYRLVSIIFKDEGYKAFYRGLIPTIVGIVPYAGITWLLHNEFKQYLASYYDGEIERAPNIYRFLSSGIAGLAGQLISYPAEILRKNMQAIIINKDGNVTIKNTFIELMKRDSWNRSLFKGFSLNFIKTPISIAISLTMFDILK